MNERMIRELALHSEQYANDFLNPQGKKFDDVVMEKFAELIVKECVKAADEWYQYHNEIQWDPGEHIKQHFGVEE